MLPGEIQVLKIGVLLFTNSTVMSSGHLEIFIKHSSGSTVFCELTFCIVNILFPKRNVNVCKRKYKYINRKKTLSFLNILYSFFFLYSLKNLSQHGRGGS